MARSGPSPCVVDTNVPLVSNGASTASPECVISCTRSLQNLIQKGQIVIDDGWRIISEYMHRLNPSGQPGPGDEFLKWLLTNQASTDRCVQVAITPLDDDAEDFEEFPQSLRNIGFDRSDRKFVAVSVAHGGSPSILQAFDSGWWGWRADLETEKIAVTFLCQEELAARHEKKKRGAARAVQESE